MELPAATQKPDKAHALLFALELLFELLFALELLFELLFMELLFIIRPGAAVYGDAVCPRAAVYNSPWCS